ncbi:hypothetical protein YC2023_073507 [Brassica napus]
MRGIQTRTKSEVDPKTVTKLVHRSDETTEEENDNKLKSCGVRKKFKEISKNLRIKSKLPKSGKHVTSTAVAGKHPGTPLEEDVDRSNLSYLDRVHKRNHESIQQNMKPELRSSGLSWLPPATRHIRTT